MKTTGHCMSSAPSGASHRVARRTVRLAGLALWAMIVWFSWVPDGSAQIVDWAFSPGLVLQQGYDDNILFSDEDELEDVVTRCTGIVRLHGTGERSKFTLTSDLIGEVYWKESSLSVFMNKTRATLEQQWNERFSSNIGIDFSKDETLDSELEAAGLAAVRNTRYRYSGNLDSTYLITERLFLRGGVSGGGTYYADETYPDQNNLYVFINPYYSLTPFDKVGLHVFASYDDYRDSADITTTGSYLYWRRDLNETTYFSLSAGYRHTWTHRTKGSIQPVFDPVSGQLINQAVEETATSSDDGFILDLSLSRAWSERFSTVFSAGQRQYSTVNAESVQNTYVRGTFRYRLTEKTRLNLGLSYDYNRKDQSQGIDDSRYLRITPSISHRLAEDLTLQLAASFAQRTDPDSDLEADRFRTWIGLSWNWPRLLANH